jgi:hypothetical protein
MKRDRFDFADACGLDEDQLAIYRLLNKSKPRKTEAKKYRENEEFKKVKTGRFVPKTARSQ